MLTAIINPIYLLCLILFDINALFLLSVHINVFGFLRVTKDCMIRNNYPLEKVGLGQKTGMLNYCTNMSRHFKGLQRQYTFCLLG